MPQWYFCSRSYVRQILSYIRQIFLYVRQIFCRTYVDLPRTYVKCSKCAYVCNYVYSSSVRGLHYGRVSRSIPLTHMVLDYTAMWLTGSHCTWHDCNVLEVLHFNVIDRFPLYWQDCNVLGSSSILLKRSVPLFNLLTFLAPPHP